MRRGTIILLQEVHGQEPAIRAVPRQYPYQYCLFISAGANPGTGGVAFLVPWHSERTLAAIDPSLIPTFDFEVLAAGRDEYDRRMMRRRRRKRKRRRKGRAVRAPGRFGPGEKNIPA